MDHTQPVTWSLLVILEPRLGQLHLDCRFADHRDPDGFDPELAWNGSPDMPGLKHQLEHLVGAKAEGQDPLILSSQAYDLASTECRKVLPASRPGIRRLESQENQPRDSDKSL